MTQHIPLRWRKTPFTTPNGIGFFWAYCEVTYAGWETRAGEAAKRAMSAAAKAAAIPTTLVRPRTALGGAVPPTAPMLVPAKKIIPESPIRSPKALKREELLQQYQAAAAELVDVYLTAFITAPFAQKVDAIVAGILRRYPSLAAAQATNIDEITRLYRHELTKMRGVSTFSEEMFGQALEGWEAKHNLNNKQSDPAFTTMIRSVFIINLMAHKRATTIMDALADHWPASDKPAAIAWLAATLELIKQKIDPTDVRNNKSIALRVRSANTADDYYEKVRLSLNQLIVAAMMPERSLGAEERRLLREIKADQRLTKSL